MSVLKKIVRFNDIMATQNLFKRIFSSINSCFENIYFHCKLLSASNRFLCKGRLHHCKISIKGRDNSLIIEKGCSLRHVTIELSGNDNIVHLRHGVYFRGGGKIRMKNSGNQLFINKRTIVNDVSFLLDDSNCKIIVGERSLLSDNVELRTGDSHSIYGADGARVNKAKDVVIGNHVWVESDVRIARGGTVGDNSVVEAHSVVTDETIPANSVAAGNPAAVVKTGCNWSL
jgi:acetyltransferase-like isoleucine patch superfamily enzyme